MKKTYMLIICLCLWLTSCSTYRINYDIVLKNIEQYNQVKRKIITPENILTPTFNDELIDIVWSFYINNASFTLINKTDYSIELIWDKAAFVDTEGISHRITHSGVKYIDRNLLQPASIIPRKEKFNDTIIPTDCIYYSAGRYGGWKEINNYIFPAPKIITIDWGSKKDFEKFLNGYIGKTCQFLLPLQINNILYEYIFIFEIKNIEMYLMKVAPN